ncbi:hypothetical protein SCLARK_00672 [Spiroplasma clarkii]|nr:hypothetical protein SCLARK_00672 [Spiroplasma clarkii]
MGYEIERCFYAIIKLSFKTLRGVNWRKITEMQPHTVVKSKTGTRFEISLLEFPYLYELKSESNGVIYWTNYELRKIKDNKTEIIITETVKFSSALNGFRANIGKMNFNKEFDKKVKQITLAIFEEVKNLDEY